MGQKVNLYGFCFGIMMDYVLCWFFDLMKLGQCYVDYVVEDIKICNLFKMQFDCVGVLNIEIECICDCVCVDIYIVCLGIVIGCCGVEVECICGDFEKFLGKQIQLNIFEVKNFEVDVQLVVQGIVEQFFVCVVFCCVMCKGLQGVQCVGVKGICIQVFGCFGGVEMSCLEFYCEGCVLLYMLCVNIDYGFYEVKIIFGCIGVKVWIYKGDLIVKEFVCEQVNVFKVCCDDCGGDCCCVLCNEVFVVEGVLV